MNTENWTDRAADVVATAIPDGFEELQQRWLQFDSNIQPVVTIFGSYDTGKSSLIRRLFVDADETVPEWLTISARHETFEVSEAELKQYVVRDTPGIVSDSDSVRGDTHTHRALAASGLTDVLIVALNPQLATAEYQDLAAVFAQPWPRGGLIAVIGCFDNAGIDPADDIEGYRALQTRKRDELRKAFELSADFPIYTLAADPYQTAGQVRQPSPAVWDAFRSWDGVAELEGALDRLPDSVSDLRRVAKQRFWFQATVETVKAVGDSRADAMSDLKVANAGLQRRRLLHSQLDVISQAAVAGARAKVEESVLSATRTAGLSADTFKVQAVAAMETWYEEHSIELDKLEDEIGSEIERRRVRPSWQAFVAAYATEDDAMGEHRSSRGWFDAFTQIEPKVRESLRQYLEASSSKSLTEIRKQAETVGRAKKSVNLLKVYDALDAGMPVVVELTQLVNELAADRKAAESRERRRRQLQTEVGSLAEAVADLALESWQEEAAQVGHSIDAATTLEVNAIPGLEEAIAHFESVELRAQALIAEYAGLPT